MYILQMLIFLTFGIAAGLGAKAVIKQEKAKSEAIGISMVLTKLPLKTLTDISI